MANDQIVASVCGVTTVECPDGMAAVEFLVPREHASSFGLRNEYTLTKKEN